MLDIALLDSALLRARHNARPRPGDDAGSARLGPLARRLTPCATLAVATLLLGCGAPSDTGEVEFRIPVEVVEIGTGDVEDLVLTTGTLRPPEVVTLNIEAPGYLQIGRDAAGERLVEGAQVTQGQTIAQVTGEDARLHARIESTRSTLSNASAELERRRELFEGGLVAEEELRQSEVAYENALYEFERSKLNASKATLVTPIDGVLLTLARNAAGMPLADGQLVAPGFQVARIAALDPLIADVDLVGPELAKVRPGLDVRVRHYAFAAARLTGKVLRLAPEMNATTHTFRAEVAVDNEAQLLRPGMFVEVTIIAEQRLEVPVAPRESVASRAGKSVVFVLDGQRVSRREVALGLGDDAVVEVVDGLAAGDRIVVRGLETLTDGTRVRVVDS